VHVKIFFKSYYKFLKNNLQDCEKKNKKKVFKDLLFLKTLYGFYYQVFKKNKKIKKI